jgi:hypothetical protein
MTFENKGRENTGNAVTLAIRTAKERNIRYIVISSNSGESALLLAGSGLDAVCVTHVNGFVKKGENEMAQEMRQRLISEGIAVLTTTHVLSGAERGLSKKFGGIHPVEMIAQTLRMFGQGTKVCVECSVMALDAGLIPYGEPIVALGGTGRGIDTVLILKPEHASSILDSQIHEIICKPYNV